MRGAGGSPCAAGGQDAVHANGRSYGKGGGTADGAQSVAAAAAQPGRAAAAMSAICAYDPRDGAMREVPELALARPVVDCCVAPFGVVLLTAGGEVLCHMGDCEGPLGVGDSAPRGGLRVVRFPWPAAAVCCDFDPVRFVAFRDGGTEVCSLRPRDADGVGRSGDHDLPAMVEGLPRGDPVKLLVAGGRGTIVITQSDEAYGWCVGRSEAIQGAFYGRIMGRIHLSDRVSRLPPLCGYRLKRLSWGDGFLLGETREGQLLAFGCVPLRSWPGTHPELLRPLAGHLAFPLRSIAAAGRAAAVADAAGQLWCMWLEQQLARQALPPASSVVRAAVAGGQMQPFAVAVTVWGLLWECRPDAPCRSIAPLQPLGSTLLPYGGDAQTVVLIPDLSCGLPRCRLLFLIAGRCGLLPGGLMRRVALAPFLVYDDWICSEQEAAAAEGEVSVAE
eukprot:TRINITY_DN11971_c0_g1_i3.p1 TRINITY_DN11971_c0_g1~~TRINITY_DN11971_c0_g1_i3.p1  ORF type:complete len:470 (+),score=47.74 TRINITY_DN11971_c0_g1_i3:75-1412(+)